MDLKRLFLVMVIMVASITATFFLLIGNPIPRHHIDTYNTRVISPRQEEVTLVHTLKTIEEWQKTVKESKETNKADTKNKLKDKSETKNTPKTKTGVKDIEKSETETKKKPEIKMDEKLNIPIDSEQNNKMDRKDAKIIKAATDVPQKMKGGNNEQVGEADDNKEKDKEAKDGAPKMKIEKEDTKKVKEAKDNNDNIKEAKDNNDNIKEAKDNKGNIKEAKDNKGNIKEAKDNNDNIKEAKDNKDTIKEAKGDEQKIKLVKETSTAKIGTGMNKPGSGKSEIRDGGKKRYLIYHCDGSSYCGGWGDRQRGIVSVYILSIVTNRTFGINMSSPCDLKQFYIPNKVDWFVKAREMRGLSSIFVDAMDRHDDMYELPNLDFNKVYPQDVVYLQTNVNYVYALRKNPFFSKVLPQWARSGKGHVFKVAWTTLMKYSPHFEEHVDNILAYVADNNLICAHVRLRKNPTIPNDAKSINSASTVKHLWTFLDKYVTDKSRVFIATDSMDVRKMAKEHFKGKQFDTGGFIIHIDRQRKWKEACTGFEMALLDQAILTYCKVLVCSNSNFSERAAMLMDIKDVFLFKNGTITKLRY